MLLDMYPKGPVDDIPYRRGSDPLEIAEWFDSGNYTIERNTRFGNLWIQGGPRARTFFTEAPERAPALNKVPLVKWDRRYAYVSSTHMLLPRGLNLVYDEWGGEKASGALLHTKFLPGVVEKSQIEKHRRQHFHDPEKFSTYYDGIINKPDLWGSDSVKLRDWQQLETLGLLNGGSFPATTGK